MATIRKDLIAQAKMPVGRDTKEKLDKWINENVNLPLAKRGWGDTGAALSAALSAGGELMIPDDLADAAMSMVPGMRILKSGKKGLKALKKVADKAPVALDYGAIEKAEKAKRAAKRADFDKMAETLKYEEGGKTITRKVPDLYDNELRQLEARKQRNVKK